ncbi:hypothetical protein Bca52824_088583 [Brassica carinata]|uniref:Ubiquitin-like protease family profile domain-containing protein n=1 Tax=Brassica carinata TaxID=52824 RepID=A0A8X7TNS5_BRACI|nr:hypothetical protein Bca52824_088583 [Brassica carinata]
MYFGLMQVIPLVSVYAQPTEDSGILSLSDGYPAPESPKNIPSMEENHLAKQLWRCKTVHAPDLLSPLPQIEWDLFEKIISKFSAAFHITPSKLDFSNNFLLQLAQPMKWTTTYHMEILMHMLAARHRGVFEEKKLAFITPHLTSGIQAISKEFNKSRKRDTFKWDEQLTGFVLQPGKKWMEDVVTVYTPMIWGDKHWVGLAINLDLGCVEVLDPLPTLYKDTTAGRFMAPVLKALPYLVKKVANYQLTQFHGLAPFTWHRIKDFYINEKGGDCGPVTVKFLEMHAHGDPEHMSSITDIKLMISISDACRHLQDHCNACLLPSLGFSLSTNLLSSVRLSFQNNAIFCVRGVTDTHKQCNMLNLSLSTYFRLSFQMCNVVFFFCLSVFVGKNSCR